MFLQPFKNIKIIISSRTIQKQVARLPKDAPTTVVEESLGEGGALLSSHSRIGSGFFWYHPIVNMYLLLICHLRCQFLFIMFFLRKTHLSNDNVLLVMHPISPNITDSKEKEGRNKYLLITFYNGKIFRFLKGSKCDSKQHSPVNVMDPPNRLKSWLMPHKNKCTCRMGSLWYNPKNCAISSILHHTIPPDPLIESSWKRTVAFCAHRCVGLFKEHLFPLNQRTRILFISEITWQIEAGRSL